MPGATATPLCETCQYHETNTKRISFMWGAGWSAAAIFGIAIVIIFGLIAANTAGIEQTRKVVARNERITNTSINQIQHTLTVMSINQKRQMEKAGVEYLDPEPIHFGIIED